MHTRLSVYGNNIAYKMNAAGLFFEKYPGKVKAGRMAGVAMLLVILIYFAIPPPTPLFRENYSTIIKAENGNLLHTFLNADEQWHFPPDSTEVSDKLKTAVIVFEDESFYSHPGVDLKAVFRAAYHNFRQGRISSGASTIPMQITRMAYPKRRTYYNKIKEAIFAIKLSLYYSKDDLLKLYLDHAPYGGNVIGANTASFMYFGKDAGNLTWSEAATLAVLPNAPGLIYPSGSSSALRNKRNLLLQGLHEKGYIEGQTYHLAKLEPIADRHTSTDSKVPHLARSLKYMYPGNWIIKTTIDEYIQEQSNQIARRYRDIYRSYGINNLSILIADTRTGAVKAYVGSPDFFDHVHGGQVDGVMSSRSSGSILKPFLYALSFDEGLIIPDSYIRDLPSYFEGFSPRNASREYQGVATAREALIHSLNIPAVRLLNSYGVFQFYSFLKAAGVSSLFRNADEYGLPLILGGAEVNLWDMAMLYRGMANGGIFKNNYVVSDGSSLQSTHLISEGSCYLTLDILNDLKRPGSEYFWKSFNSAMNISWKTGTSYGHKDAWAVGVNPEYTIAVWVGNFNGESNKNLSGATSAGPLLFDLLRVLPHKDDPSYWFEKQQDDFRQLEICRLSGFRAGGACPETVTTDVPRGMKPLKACEYHQFRHFSADELYQSCSRCWHEVGNIRKAVTAYPPDIAFYLREKGQFIAKPAVHYPSCPAYKPDKSVKIIYPNMEAKLFLPRDFDGKMQSVICIAGHSSSGQKVYWYLDDQYIGMTTGDHKMSVKFSEGWNTLKVIDQNGAEHSQSVFTAN